MPRSSDNLIANSKVEIRHLLNSKHMGIWQLDENATVIFVNEYLAELLGFSTKEMLGRSALDFLPSGDADEFMKILAERAKGVARQYEKVVYNKQNQKLHLLVQPTLISHNRLYQGSIATVIDITELKKDQFDKLVAEEELRKTEQRYKIAEQQGNLGHWQWELDTNALIWSDQLYRIFDVELGKKITFDDFFFSVHPEDRERLQAVVDNGLKKGENYNIKHRILKKDGAIAYIQEFAEVVKNENGKIYTVTGIAQDITSQIQYEQKLKTSEEQLNLIFESTTNPMWLLNVEEGNVFRCEQVNQAFCKATGIEKKLLISKSIDEIPQLQSIFKITDKYAELIKNGKIYTATTFFSLPAGDVTAETTIVPIRDGDGSIKKILGVAVDITEKKKSEDELLSKNKILRDLTVYLQKVREEERIRIAREIHDELGQQLTGIKMDISWINKKISIKDELQKNKIQDLFRLIDNTINSVRRIASDLRPSILDDLGLNEAFKWQINQFTNRHGIPVDFSTQVEDEIFSTHITTALFRIFQETLTNVARHSQATQVFCEFKKQDDNLLLIIKDNGIGFNIKKNDKIKSLGLLGMKERVEMLNGKYEIISCKNKGTTISVSFPLN